MQRLKRPGPRLFFPAALAVATLLSTTVRAEDVFTSFEFNAEGPFTVGDSPISATFSAGVAESRGVPEFYVTGFRAWHIRPGETAIVTFETPASALDFFARTSGAGVNSRIRIFDVASMVLSDTVPGDSFENIAVNRAPGQSLIGSFEVANTGGGDVIIDDLTFTAEVEEPPPPDPEDRLIDLAALADVDNSGAADLAVLDASLEDAVAAPAQGHLADTIHVRDGGTGTEIHQTSLSSGWQSLALDAVAGNQGMLLAVLQINDTGNIRVQLKQASDGAQVRNISCFDDTWTPIDLLSVRDAGGPGVGGIGVLASNQAGQQAIETYKVGNGALVARVLFFNDVWTASAAIDLGEFNGNERSELAVLATNGAGKHAVETRDALSGARISREFYLSSQNTIVGLATVPDVDNNARPEIVVLGKKNAGNNTAQAKDVKTGALVSKQVTFGPDWTGFGMRALNDVDGNSSPEVVVAALNDNDNETTIQVRDIAGATLTKKVSFMGPAYDPKDVEVLDDVSGNGIQEVVIVGRRPDTGDVRIQLRDALTGTRLRNIDLP